MHAFRGRDGGVEVGVPSAGAGQGEHGEADYKHRNFKCESGSSSRSGGLGPGQGQLGTPAVCDPGGGLRAKAEPMDADSGLSLNTRGPQAATPSPGALTCLTSKILKEDPEPRFRHPSGMTGPR